MKGKSTKRVLMVGLDNAGKTTILYKLALDEIVSTIPTVGLNIETITYKDIKFHVWDLGGQLSKKSISIHCIQCKLSLICIPHNLCRKKIRSLWSNYYQDTDAIIFVIDSNEKERIDELRNDNVKHELYKLLNNKLLSSAILLIFANKQDLPNAININEITKRLELESLKNRTWMIQETCAMNGDGLYQGLEWLSNTINKKSKHRKNITQKYNQLHE